MRLIKVLLCDRMRSPIQICQTHRHPHRRTTTRMCLYCSNLKRQTDIKPNEWAEEEDYKRVLCQSNLLLIFLPSKHRAPIRESNKIIEMQNQTVKQPSNKHLMRITNTKCTMVWIMRYLVHNTLINVRCAMRDVRCAMCVVLGQWIWMQTFRQSFKQHWKALIVFCYERVTSAPLHAHNMVK